MATEETTQSLEQAAAYAAEQVQAAETVEEAVRWQGIQNQQIANLEKLQASSA